MSYFATMTINRDGRQVISAHIAADSLSELLNLELCLNDWYETPAVTLKDIVGDRVIVIQPIRWENILEEDPHLRPDPEERLLVVAGQFLIDEAGWEEARKYAFDFVGRCKAAGLVMTTADATASAPAAAATPVSSAPVPPAIPSLPTPDATSVGDQPLADKAREFGNDIRLAAWHLLHAWEHLRRVELGLDGTEIELLTLETLIGMTPKPDDAMDIGDEAIRQWLLDKVEVSVDREA